MIVDCHTHTWESNPPPGISGGQSGAVTGVAGGRPLTADLAVAGVDRHLEACEHVNWTVVCGFSSRYLDARISNDHVAAYVRQHPHRLIGFAGVDPSDWRSAIDELRRCRHELGMVGASVAPPAQDFHPSDSKAMRVYEQAAELGMAVLFHQGPFMTAACKLEYARPLLLDEVARELPTLRIVIAHLGHPWIEETILLLAKHPHVYAEISGVLHRPWQGYQALLTAYQDGVMRKLLFGSGFPMASAARTIEMLYDVNHLCHGNNLPTVPRRELHGVVERDALSLLNIHPSGGGARGSAMNRSSALDPDHREAEATME